MNRLQYLALAAIVALGCGRSGPSYNEALQTYNAEIEALEHLEARRDKILAEYELERKKQIAADMEDRKQRYEQEDLRRFATARGDQIAVVQAEVEARDNRLLEEYEANWAPKKAQKDKEIAEIDEQIRTQTERVERALASKEALAK